MSERLFHVLVVAALHADADHSTSTASRDPVRFERASFDEAMAAVGPELAIDVPDPAGGKPIRVDLAFKAMRSFRPDALTKDVALLRGLPSPAAAGGASPAASSLIDDILGGMSAAAPASDPKSSVLDAITSHPAVQRLEQAWRGLHLLASRSDRDKVVVDAVHAHADDVAGTLEALARRTDLAPFDLIVVDHTLGASARDLARIEAWAALAEGMGAPLVANGAPELVGEESLTTLGRSQRRLRASEDPRATAVRSLAAKDTMRWIALAMNGALARPAGTVFVGAAHLVASLACASFAATGWACALTGPTHGTVRDLPVHSVDDRGTEVATPLEALTSEQAAIEAAAAGVIVFASAPNSDVAILSRAPMLHRPASTGGGTSPAASLGLADQIFVAFVARAVVQLADAIAQDTPPNAACEVAQLALAELFAGAGSKRPAFEISVAGAPACLEVTVRPRGFFDVRLEEISLAAPLG